MNVIYENILVEIPEITKEKNGVIIPEEEQVIERQGIVVRYGEGVPGSVKTQLNSKPTVKYKEYYDGSEFTIECKDYIVMNYNDILIIF